MDCDFWDAALATSASQIFLAAAYPTSAPDAIFPVVGAVLVALKSASTEYVPPLGPVATVRFFSRALTASANALKFAFTSAAMIFSAG